MEWFIQLMNKNYLTVYFQPILRLVVLKSWFLNSLSKSCKLISQKICTTIPVPQILSNLAILENKIRQCTFDLYPRKKFMRALNQINIFIVIAISSVYLQAQRWARWQGSIWYCCWWHCHHPQVLRQNIVNLTAPVKNPLWCQWHASMQSSGRSRSHWIPRSRNCNWTTTPSSR